MIINQAQSKRAFLKLIMVGLSSATVLSACDSTNKKTQQVNQKLMPLLRHHGMAAHLGRLSQQSNSNLQSPPLKKLVKEILNDLGLDIKTLTEVDIENLPDLVAQKIRQDFAQQQVVAVDGWLLSKTEVKLCMLILHNIEQNSG